MAITSLHQDIITTHILTKLDGAALAAAACTSSQFYTLCTQEKLWQHICTSTWPSLNTPLVRDTVSTFPAGHRSFYADSISSATRKFKFNHGPNVDQSPTCELISAVDIHYKDKLVYSNVKVTKTVTKRFLDHPIWIDILGHKEIINGKVMFKCEESVFLSDLEKYLNLSWILMDPGRRRAMNVSSGRAVLARKHWFTGEIMMEFTTTIIGSDESKDLWEYSVGNKFFSCSVKFKIQVMCGRKKDGELYVREVSLQVVDMDGKCLNGKESLVVLGDAMESGRRRWRQRGERRNEGLHGVWRIFLFIVFLFFFFFGLNFSETGVKQGNFLGHPSRLISKF